MSMPPPSPAHLRSNRLAAVVIEPSLEALVATTDGVHFNRRPLPEEREALLAYLRRK